jgi:hypothetical protein
VSRSEWRLIVEAMWLLAQVRVALWIHPFKHVQRRYARRTHPTASAATTRSGSVEARAIGIAVRRASRLVPAATCLPQALTTRVMLERRGIPNELVIGVTKAGTGTLEAHAWIEVDDRVIVGHLNDLSRFHRMPELPDEYG